MGFLDRLLRRRASQPASSVADEFLRKSRYAVAILRRFYRELHLEGLEADLYRGPHRRGFTHDVRSIVQRPDYYKLGKDQSACVGIIRMSIEENLLQMEQMLVVDKTKIPPALELDVVNLFDEDLYWTTLIDRREADQKPEARISGCWPQYVKTAAALKLEVMRDSVSASGHFRKFNDAFHAWDATQGKIRFGDPWQDLARRFEAASKAIAEAEVYLPKEDLGRRNAALSELAGLAERAEKRRRGGKR